MATIVYTSGTTGSPKGAVLLHSNLAAEIRGVVSHVQMNASDITLTFLPFAHILGRVESLSPIIAGMTLGFAENLNTVAQNIREVHPTIMVSVPRIYEKIFAKIQSEVEAHPGLKKSIFGWALKVGKEVANLRAEKKAIPLTLSLKLKIADALVFEKVREKMGGRLRLTVSGGAPLSRDICEFFHACGIKILEGYGLTETTAAVTANHPNDYRFGTVGKPLPGTELKIAQDGEIWVRGPLVMKEYFRNPEATEAALTPDGFFCTGDIGEIDDRGFLKITDRKKELIVTSGGKKIAPQKLENLLKTCRFISNCMVYGDKQKFISALITLNEPECANWAKAQGLSATKSAELCTESKVIELIEQEVQKLNAQLASYESIKKIRILPIDFTVEAGELTPSMKLKRKVCTEKFSAYIKEMYA